jgi:methylphosphotriester-DNA--protein-cysteine methyltransferase
MIKSIMQIIKTGRSSLSARELSDAVWYAALYCILTWKKSTGLFPKDYRAINITIKNRSIKSYLTTSF